LTGAVDVDVARMARTPPYHLTVVPEAVGDGPCVILAASSRQFQKDGPWGYYTVDETARRYGACPDVETQDAEVAYANVPPSQASRYRDGVLPT
jgi:hypothetical protein